MGVKGLADESCMRHPPSGGRAVLEPFGHNNLVSPSRVREGRPRSGRGGSSEPAVDFTTSSAVALSGPVARLSQRESKQKSGSATTSKLHDLPWRVKIQEPTTVPGEGEGAGTYYRPRGARFRARRRPVAPNPNYRLRLSSSSRSCCAAVITRVLPRY